MSGRNGPTTVRFLTRAPRILARSRALTASALLGLAACAGPARDAADAPPPPAALPVLSEPQLVETDGRATLVATLSNPTPHTFWYRSRAAGFPVGDAEQRMAYGWDWVSFGTCGVGLESFPLPPDALLPVRASIADEERPGPFRVSVYLSRTPSQEDARDVVQVVSPVLELRHTGSATPAADVSPAPEPERTPPMPTDPARLHAPDALRTERFLLRPIRASDAEADHAAVMETRELLLAWEQTGWPAEDFTVAANRDDLVRLARSHDAGESFTYAVLDPTSDDYLGCVYVMPTSAAPFAAARIVATDGGRWTDHDAAVYFWLRASRSTDALDAALLDTLDDWFRDAWLLERYLLLTSERVGRHVALMEATGRTLRFELTYPDKPGKELAYSRP